MKKTIITLVSVTALAVSANAQTISNIEVALIADAGGWSAGQTISFSNVSDFLNNTNGSVGWAGGNQNWHRDSVSGFPTNSNFWALHKTSGDVYNTNAVVANAAWIGANSADFSYNQATGVFEVGLSANAGGYVAGDYIAFNNLSDFVNNTNGVVGWSGNLAWERDSVANHPSNTDYYALNKTDARLYQTNAVIGTASWIGTNNIADFSVTQVVPEPSSTALLGLGALGLLARRKR